VRTKDFSITMETASNESESLLAARNLTSSTRLPPKQFERVSRALSEPRRTLILKQISEAGGEINCGDLAAQHEIGHQTMSHHTKELENAGLIDIRREGRFGYVSLNREVLRAFLAELSEI
jgi:ArsR family transcriptional regulator, arsenate/arsenite/antimonite-responsive transcriptional repressor